MQVHNAKTLNILFFQHNIYDLELGYFEVLEKGDFCTDLQQYLKELFSIGRKDVIANVLVKIGSCVTEDARPSLRKRALMIVTEFSSLLSGQKDRELLSIVSNILTGWLIRERSLDSVHTNLFGQVENIIKKLFSLHLWQQVEPLVSVSKRIASGDWLANSQLQKEVSKLHRTIADKKVITVLVHSFLENKSTEDVVAGDLLQALRPYSSEAMIQGLFKCNKKSKRLALLDMLSQHREGVLPILIQKLKDRQPWYVIRNSMILLGSMRDPDLYHFSRPFLNHPDSRVQREVVMSTIKLGGEQLPARLISSFPRVNDMVKPLIIEQLGHINDPRIEQMFLDVLEQLVCFDSGVREDLIEIICISGKISYSERAMSVLKKIVEERMTGPAVSASSTKHAVTVLKRLQN